MFRDAFRSRDYSRHGAFRMSIFLWSVLIILFIAGWVNGARAHSWYPYECCAGNDCAPVKSEFVKEQSGGFVFTIHPNSHPMAKGWPEARQFFVPYRDLKASPDGEWHLCIVADAVKCAFGNMGGA
jgi:hypothetical protein